jgi:DNA-binding XRE family transcriptional regulator
MSKRKPIDKTQARERRNRLLESAAAAELSLTEGVREMRAIAGMTQEEFAQHRSVSARVIKAIELGQGNPTVATLNRIGEFFGLEVAFVPVKRAATAAETSQRAGATTGINVETLMAGQQALMAELDKLSKLMGMVKDVTRTASVLPDLQASTQEAVSKAPTSGSSSSSKKKKPRSA